MIIFIIGYMGSGKSTFGKRLANRMGCDFIDLDQIFEETYRISIADFFSKYGETMFRNMEHELLEMNLNHPLMVVSCGGGTPCFFNNMDLMNANGVTLYLRLSPGTLSQRLLHSRRKRPLIETLPGENLIQKITLHLAERDSFYMKSQLIVEGISIDLQETVDKLKKFINKSNV
jgi:shikimate kinase